MIKVELIKVEHDPSTVLDFQLGLEQAKILDNLLAKLLEYPYVKEADPEYEFGLEMDEYMFLTNLAGRIGKSGIRKYIESEVK
jgi:hypothetical protein